jgi:competence protein ComEC
MLFLISFIRSKAAFTLPSVDSLLENTPKGLHAEIIEGTVDKIIDKDTYKQLFLSQCNVLIQSEQELKQESEQGFEHGFQMSNLGILVNTSECNVSCGDIIHVTGKIKAFPASRNEGEFNSFLYYHSISMDYKMSAESIELIKVEDDPVQAFLREIRQRMSNTYEMIADEKDAGILNSIVLGDSTKLDLSIKKLYQDSGIAHLLAISGLHVSIIGMTFYRLLRRLGLNYYYSFTAGTIMLIFYGILTGNAISACRAITMCMIAMFADVLGRSYDLLSALSITGVWMLLENPWVIYNAGFLLSFGAILGIGVIYPAIEKMCPTHQYHKVKKYLFQAVFISVSVNLMTLPVLLSQFFSFPIYSILLNIVVIPLMSILMACALLAGVIGMVFGKTGTFFMGAVHYILWIYETLCEWFGKLPYANIRIGAPSLKSIIAYIIFLALFVAAAYANEFMSYIRLNQFNQKRLGGIIRKMNILVIITAIACITFRQDRPMQMRVDLLDVGQGDCIFVKLPDQTTYLFDGGSSDIAGVGGRRILPFLKANAVSKIDYVFISHFDEDHISGINELIALPEEITIHNLVLPKLYKDMYHEHQENANNQYQNNDWKILLSAYDQMLKAACEQNIKVLYAEAGTMLSNEYSTLKCLHPSQSYQTNSANDASTVYLLTYKQFKMLLTGDVEANGEKDMLSRVQLPKITVLKTAHHGSDSSTTEELLEKTRPKLALISCGIDNIYGHPSKVILQRLQKKQVGTYVTTDHGQITITTDGEQVWAKNFCNKELFD